MVHVFFHHPSQILPMIFFKIPRVIPFGFGDIPLVKRFIHHIQAQFVAGVQKRGGAGIVRAADSIISRFFQNTYLPILRVGKSAGPQQTVIVVDTAAPQFDRGSVDLQA